MTFAIKLKWRTGNPCSGAVEKNAEPARKRYLSPAELQRLTKALAEHPDQRTANAVRLLLLSGSRKHEVLGAKWEQIDFERGVWTKPASTTKQATEHELPLSAPALQLLRAMRKAAPDATFLFPTNRGASGHAVEIKKPWRDICKRAGLTDFRTHDLRHSHASFLKDAGYDLLMIGKLLGHAHVATTQRYVHLFDEPQRQATNKVGARMTGLVAKPPKGKSKLKLVG